MVLHRILKSGTAAFSGKLPGRSREIETAEEIIIDKAASRGEESKQECQKIFPPPLTTMSGSNTLQVHKRRECGRLVLEAVEAPSRNSHMQAERSGGIGRIWLLTIEIDKNCACLNNMIPIFFLGPCDGWALRQWPLSPHGRYGSGLALFPRPHLHPPLPRKKIEEKKVVESDYEFADEVADEEETDGSESEKEEIDGEMDKFHGLNRCKGRRRGHGREGLCSDLKLALWVATS
ncbi:uncharacterized protein LOC142526105 [Primulina tabacum]|uniref:uncharacterized protein LOC142526105 n=1 Tax=Primulina tabacum TaxID=48773 RepID=UPI003F5AD83B